MKTWLPLLVVVLMMSACSSGSDTGSSLTPTVVTGTPVTESFTGTVAVGSGNSDIHTFTVTLGGNIAVTLTAAGPPSTIFMGLGIGTYSASTCTLLSGGSGIFQAGASAQLSGPLAQGAYCVAVYDVGNATAPVTYTVTVTHT